MATIDAKALAKALAASWKVIAGTHWKAVQQLSKEDLAFLQQRAVGLAADLTNGLITEEQARMEKDDMIESLKGMEDVLAVEGKVLAQDLINSALSIIGSAVNKAVGFPLF